MFVPFEARTLHLRGTEITRNGMTILNPQVCVSLLVLELNNCIHEFSLFLSITPYSKYMMISGISS